MLSSVGAIPLWLPILCGVCLFFFGAVVFFDLLRYDMMAEVMGGDEFTAVDAEGLEGLVEVGFGEL